jgi:hypothetical protein
MKVGYAAIVGLGRSRSRRVTSTVDLLLTGVIIHSLARHPAFEVNGDSTCVEERISHLAPSWMVAAYFLSPTAWNRAGQRTVLEKQRSIVSHSLSEGGLRFLSSDLRSLMPWREMSP